MAATAATRPDKTTDLIFLDHAAVVLGVLDSMATFPSPVSEASSAGSARQRFLEGLAATGFSERDVRDPAREPMPWLTAPLEADTVGDLRQPDGHPDGQVIPLAPHRAQRRARGGTSGAA